METTNLKSTSGQSENIKKLFLSEMDEAYSLIHTVCEDTYNDSPGVFQDCLDMRSSEPLDNNQWQADRKYEGSLYQWEVLKNKILNNSKYEDQHPYIAIWLEDEDNESLLIDAIEDKDISTPIEEMVGRTKVRGRATLYTDYLYLPSNGDLKNTYEYDEYFKDIVDVLCLNPAKVKNVFTEKSIKTIGEWPDKQSLNGHEAVLYEEFAEELVEQNCYCLLTFMGMMPLSNLYANGFQEYLEIIVPKGNRCGLFNSWDGQGSVMGMKLLKDLTIPVNRPDRTGNDRFEICVDERKCDTGYCIDSVYGLISSCWKKEFQLIYKSTKKNQDGKHNIRSN